MSSEKNEDDPITLPDPKVGDLDSQEVYTWLKQLQRQSWELELLVTGFSIFLLLQIPTAVNRLTAVLMAGEFFSQTRLVIAFLEFAKAAAGMITFNLVIHVVLRGIWIGLVGLSSVFPGGIVVENLRFSPIFRERLQSRRFDLYETILSLDKVASSIFSFTFLIGCYAFSLSIFFIVFLVLLRVWFFTMDGYPGILRNGAGALMAIYYLTGMIGLLNFLTLDGLKRFKRTARFYKYIDTFLSRLTLSFLYRSIHYTLASNYNRYLIYGLTMIYMAAFLALTTSQVVNHSRWYPTDTNHFQSANYDNRRPKDTSIEIAALESDVISGPLLKVFIRYHQDDDKRIAKVCPDLESPLNGSVFSIFDMNYSTNYKPPEPKAEAAWSAQTLACAAKIYRIYLDDQLQEEVQLMYYTHQNKGERGYVAWLPLDPNRPGLRRVRLDRVSLPRAGKKQPPWRTLTEIPFLQLPAKPAQ